MYRSSLEVTGPLYPLLLWPWAKLWPAAFPFALFIISWTGTLLAVSLLLFTELLPFGIALLVAFGFLFGFEYAVVSRLYGWGSFFLIGGILCDKKKKAWASTILFCAALLTQLSFSFGVAAWCAYRVFSAKSWKKAGQAVLERSGVFFGLLLLWLHLRLAQSVRVWNAWHWVTRISKVGTTFSIPFFQSYGKIGWGGLVAAFFVFYPLKVRARWALLVGLLPFLLLFLFHTQEGLAQARHGGALFVVFVFLFAEGLEADDAQGSVKNFQLGLFLLPLLVSLVAGLLLRVEEIRWPYSEGLAVASIIEKKSEGHPKKIFVKEDLYGFVVAAKLNDQIWTSFDFLPIDHPQFTVEREQRVEREARKLPWDAYLAHCAVNERCFVIDRPSDESPPPELKYIEEIHRAGWAITDERLNLYEIHRPNGGL